MSKAQITCVWLFRTSTRDLVYSGTSEIFFQRLGRGRKNVDQDPRYITLVWFPTCNDVASRLIDYLSRLPFTPNVHSQNLRLIIQLLHCTCKEMYITLPYKHATCKCGNLKDYKIFPKYINIVIHNIVPGDSTKKLLHNNVEFLKLIKSVLPPQAAFQWHRARFWTCRKVMV